MQEAYPCIHFERDADDIVVHCRSRKQVEWMADKIKARLLKCKLMLSEEKTQMVYCKDSNRNETYLHDSVDFMGYTFRPRSSRNCQGKFLVSFTPAVSRTSLKAMRTKIKEHPMIKGCFSQSIEELASALNPILQGWINYYGQFRQSSLSAIYDYTNEKIMKWARRKYKHLQRRKTQSSQWLKKVYLHNPTLFAHWRVWSWVAE
jgi:RNA-directed DNA polymerase